MGLPRDTRGVYRPWYSHNSSPSKGRTKLMQWCRPSPKINSGRTLIPSDVILKIVVIRSRSSGVKSVIFNPFSWTKKRRKIFRECRDGGFSHTFCKSVFPPPLSKTVEYLFQGVGTEDFHTFFASQLFFTPFSWIVGKF